MTLLTEANARKLLRDYASAIDRYELARWPTFFANDCRYRITTRENAEHGLPLSIVACENRAMLFDRLEAIERANVFEPHRYRHILSDSEVTAHDGASLSLRTSFLVVRIMEAGESMLFVCGEYLDEIVSEDGACRFRSRVVVIDQSRIDTLIAIPL